MTTARSELVDLDLTRYYHCISRCVRGAFLCGEGFAHRKAWIENRIELLATQFAVSVAGFAVMDNHLHLLVRIDPDDVNDWSDEEVLRRWIAVYPPATLALDDPKVVQMWVDHHAQNTKRIAQIRERLSDLSWFMKALKEPLSRLANKEDDCKGAFWEGRFKSIAILDEEALLTVCTYIDLNPVAAGIAATPETSPHTSVRQRVRHVKSKGKLDVLKSAKKGTAIGLRSAKKLDADHWLVPVCNQRTNTEIAKKSRDSQGFRAGLFESISLGSYLLVVEYTGRLYRNGKAQIHSSVNELFERLGTSADIWTYRLQKMLDASELRGRYFAGDSEKVREVSKSKNRRHLSNLSTV